MAYLFLIVFNRRNYFHYYLEMGLPVIPFAQLILHERDEEAERDPESHLKKLRRKSNDLKKELSDFRFRKNTIDEEDEDESRTKNKEVESHSTSRNMVEFRNRVGKKINVI